ncbi:hypothetical protein XM38_006780 [Halomicronema hongdechloris C2206]|uniref:Uncharacterized protein n=1 Tax=Halomicronema hongdechloris C2206 TaxID=1641165 RepID=A0A1Z3HHF6_9CYAN|nr:hypothetical protein XM38_006780 [Halomicronema hongdechloris C2206]
MGRTIFRARTAIIEVSAKVNCTMTTHPIVLHIPDKVLLAEKTVVR